MNFSQFIKSHQSNLWIEERNFRAYVRKSKRFFGRGLTPCLDIASIEVDEALRGTGVFTKFRKRVEKKAAALGMGVFVESVLEPRLAQHLLKIGYLKYPPSGDVAPCFYKKS